MQNYLKYSKLSATNESEVNTAMRVEKSPVWHLKGWVLKDLKGCTQKDCCKTQLLFVSEEILSLSDL